MVGTCVCVLGGWGGGSVGVAGMGVLFQGERGVAGGMCHGCNLSCLHCSQSHRSEASLEQQSINQGSPQDESEMFLHQRSKVQPDL